METTKKWPILLFVAANALIPMGLMMSFPSLAGEPETDPLSRLAASAGLGMYLLGFLYSVLAWYSATGKPRIIPAVFSVLGIIFIVVGLSLEHAFPTVVGNAWSLLLSFAGFGFAIGGMCTFIDLARTPRRSPVRED